MEAATLRCADHGSGKKENHRTSERHVPGKLSRPGEGGCGSALVGGCDGSVLRSSGAG
jgi:hypothetical protein